MRNIALQQKVMYEIEMVKVTVTEMMMSTKREMMMMMMISTKKVSLFFLSLDCTLCCEQSYK